MALLPKLKGLLGLSNGQSSSSHLTELLGTLQRERSPVQIKLSNGGRGDGMFNSYVLSVKPARGNLALQFDELVPRDGNDVARRLGRMTVMIDYQGTQAHFSVPITKFDGTYHTPLPAKAHVDGQRSTKRLALTDLGNFPVEIYSEGRSMVKATLTDVSLGGLQLKVRLSERIAPPFRQGEIIHGVHIQMNKSNQVELQIEVRSVVTKRSQESVVIGAKIRGFKNKKQELSFKGWVRVITDRMKR